MAITYMTQEGYDKKMAELSHLENVERPEVVRAIVEARDKGDLSENAEYDAAKELQAKNEYEIAEVEAMLKNAIVIDSAASNSNTVVVGVTVMLRNLTAKKDVEYQIVGAAEADPFKKRISNNSPVGAGLLGHKVGETVEIVTPGGPVKFKIMGIRS